MSIPNEDEIHQMYSNMEQLRLQKLTHDQKMRELAMSESTQTFTGRQPAQITPSRSAYPSFRSQFFNVGEGLQAIDPGETKILAKHTIPNFHAGVLTGFSQWFGEDCHDDVMNSVTWGLRINGLVPQGFMDFVGHFGTLMFPHSVYFPLAGGAATLGSVSASIGSQTIEKIPTIYLQATNNYTASLVLQGRLEGYSFPTAERKDEFANI
jgi:hypothetical protein